MNRYTLTCNRPDGRPYIKSSDNTAALYNAFDRIKGQGLQIFDTQTGTTIFHGYVPAFLRPQAY